MLIVITFSTHINMALDHVPGLSYQTRLILLTDHDKILRAMDSKYVYSYQVDVLLLDFSKAFDTSTENY